MVTWTLQQDIYNQLLSGPAILALKALIQPQISWKPCVRSRGFRFASLESTVACRIPMADALCEQWANCLLYVPCHVPGLYWARVRATIDVCPPTLVGYTFLWKNVFFLNFFLKNKDLTTFSDCKVSHWFQKITPCLSSHGLRIMCEAKSETVAHIGGHWRCSLIRLLMPDHTGSRGEESAASESRIQCAEPGTLMVGFSSLFSSKLFCSSIPLLTLLTSLISDSQYCAEKGCEM
jgi:hypothetical protein